MREILYGRQPVRETLRAGRRQVFKLLVARGIQSTEIVGQILALAKRAGALIQEVDRKELDESVGEANHQGLAVQVSGYPYATLSGVLDSAQDSAQAPFLLLLDHVQDPQNLGSLLRTAEAAGVHGAVIPAKRAANVTPAAVRTSSGAAEHMLVAQETNLVRAIETLKREGLWIAGLHARSGAQLYTEADLSGSLGLVVGSEGKGLARLVQERCDFLIHLPMAGQVASLNAAVAGAIALYEARRQRGWAGASSRQSQEKP